MKGRIFVQVPQSEREKLPVCPDGNTSKSRIEFHATVSGGRFKRLDNLIENRRDPDILLMIEVQPSIEFRESQKLAHEARSAIDSDKNLPKGAFLHGGVGRGDSHLRLCLQAGEGV